MPIIIRKKEAGNRVNPNIWSRGVKGKIRVKASIDKVAINKFLPGWLLRRGLRLRITSTIKDAEMTDWRHGNS
jgi:hypothetical protein